MSDSDDEEKMDIDKEQLHKIEQNDIKTNKKGKRNKRLENEGKKLEEEGSEVEDSKSGSDEDVAEDKTKSKKKATPVVEHKPI